MSAGSSRFRHVPSQMDRANSFANAAVLAFFGLESVSNAPRASATQAPAALQVFAHGHILFRELGPKLDSAARRFAGVRCYLGSIKPSVVRHSEGTFHSDANMAKGCVGTDLKP